MKKSFIHCIVFLLFYCNLNIDSVAQKTNKVFKQNTYWYMMKNADGTGEEIYDNIRFENNMVISELNFSYNNRQWTEIKRVKNNDEETSVKFSIAGKDNSTYSFDCIIKKEVIYGTIKRKNSDGSTTMMVMRGMTSEIYQKIKEEKEKYRLNQAGN